MTSNSDAEPQVCVEHLRYTHVSGCPKCEDGHNWSSDPFDVQRVADYIQMRSEVL